MLWIIADDTVHMMNSRHQHVYHLKSQVRVEACDLNIIHFVVVYRHTLL
jgi:hypothetical protein